MFVRVQVFEVNIYQILLARKRNSERGLGARPESAHHPVSLAPFLLTLCNGQNL